MRTLFMLYGFAFGADFMADKLLMFAAQIMVGAQKCYELHSKDELLYTFMAVQMLMHVDYYCVLELGDIEIDFDLTACSYVF